MKRESGEAGRKQELTCCPRGSSYFQMFMCPEFLKADTGCLAHPGSRWFILRKNVLQQRQRWSQLISLAAPGLFVLTSQSCIQSSLYSLWLFCLFKQCPYLLDNAFTDVRTFCYEFVTNTVHCGFWGFFHPHMQRVKELTSAHGCRAREEQVPESERGRTRGKDLEGQYNALFCNLFIISYAWEKESLIFKLALKKNHCFLACMFSWLCGIKTYPLSSLKPF